MRNFERNAEICAVCRHAGAAVRMRPKFTSLRVACLPVICLLMRFYF